MDLVNREETSAEPVCNPASAINTECVAESAGLQVCLSQCVLKHSRCVFVC